MYGTQTISPSQSTTSMFENDVEMYGTQTVIARGVMDLCLRMM